MTSSAVARTLVATFFLAGTAWAQDQASISTARQIAIEGLQAYDEGRYEEAAEKLGNAYEVVKVPTLGRDRARALVKLGKLVEAAELYLEVTRLDVAAGDKEGQEQAKREAAQERFALLGRISRLVVEVAGIEAEKVSVEIDGVVIPPVLARTGRLVNPGRHKVVGRVGARMVTRHGTVAEGGVLTVKLSFEEPRRVTAEPTERPSAEPAATGLSAAGAPVSAPPPNVEQDSGVSVRRTTGWAALGLGGAGVLFGTVTVVMAGSKRSDLDKHGCENSHCFTDQGSDVNSYNSLRTMSTVGFVVGAVGLAGGGALLLTSPRERGQVTRRVVPWIGVGSAGVAGRF